MKVLNGLPDYVVQQCIALWNFFVKVEIFAKVEKFPHLFWQKIPPHQKNPPDFRQKIHLEEIDFNIYQENS